MVFDGVKRDIRDIILMIGISDPTIHVSVDEDCYRLSTRKGNSISRARQRRNRHTHDLLYSRSLPEHSSLAMANVLNSEPENSLKR